MTNTEWTARKTNRYTWSMDKSAFRTATVYKDGKPHATMTGVGKEANEWCEKWNGTRGNFEVKAPA